MRNRFLMTVLLLVVGTVTAMGQLYNDLRWRSEQKQRVKMRFQVEGRIYGTDSFEPNPFPLQGAAVKVTCVADSTVMDGGSVGSEGYFWSWLSVNERLKDTSLRIVISYIGMETFDSIYQPKHNKIDGIDTYVLTLDSIVLHSDPITTEEVEIVAELQKMYQRGDTIIFNADAFEMPSGSVLLDLVRRLPGLKMTDGKMTYLGQDIDEIRLNGDSFFKHDMSIALNNMPTDKLKSLKVYEVPIDTLDVTSQNHLIMDMETKDPMNKTVFGQIAVSTTEKLNHYGFEGYIDTWAKKGPSFNMSANHDDLPDNYSMRSSRTWGNIGLDHTFKNSINVDLNGNFNRNHNEDKEKSLSRNFLPDYTQESVSERTSMNENRSYASRFNASSEVGKSGYVSVGVSADRSRGISESQSTDTTFIEGTGAQTANKSHDASENNRNNYGLNVNYSTSIYKTKPDGEREYKGSFSSSLNYNTSNSENIADNGQTNRFFLLGDSVRDIRHRINTDNDNREIGLNMNYSMRLGADNNRYRYFSVGSTLNRNTSGNSSIYNNLDADGNITGRVDSLDTRGDRSRISDRITLSYNSSDSLMDSYLSASIVPQLEELDNWRGNRFEQLTQKGVQYNYNFNYRRRVFKKDRIGISSNGNNSLPSINDKSKLTDYSNQMNIREGNDNLKNPFNTRLGMEYQYHDWMRFSVNFGTTFNSISNITKIDKTSGVRYSKPVNVNGNWNVSESLFMTTDVGDVTFNWDTNHSYRKGVSFVQNTTDADPTKSFSDYHNASTTLDLAYGDRYWMVNASAGYSYNYNKSEYVSKATVGQSAMASTRLEYTTDFGLGARTTVNYSKQFGYEMESANKSELIWNMDVHYRFLKGRKAEFSISWDDILNSRNNFSANMSGTSWHEQQTFNERSMIIFKLSYRPNYFD